MGHCCTTEGKTELVDGTMKEANLSQLQRDGLALEAAVRRRSGGKMDGNTLKSEERFLTMVKDFKSFNANVNVHASHILS